MPMIKSNPNSTQWIRKLYKIGDSFVLTLPRYIIGNSWHNSLIYENREVYIEETPKTNTFLIHKNPTPNSLRVNTYDIGLYGIVLTKLNIGESRNLLSFNKQNRIIINKLNSNTIQFTFQI